MWLDGEAWSERESVDLLVVVAVGIVVGVAWAKVGFGISVS